MVKRLLKREDLEIVDYPCPSGRGFKYLNPTNGEITIYTGWSPSRLKDLLAGKDTTIMDRWQASIAKDFRESKALQKRYKNFPDEWYDFLAKYAMDAQRDFSAESGSKVHYILEIEELQNLTELTADELFKQYNSTVTGDDNCLNYLEEALMLKQMIIGLETLGVRSIEYSELFMTSALKHPHKVIPILCFADAVVPSMDLVIDFKTKLNKLNPNRDEYWIQALCLFYGYANTFGRKPEQIVFLVAGQSNYQTFVFTEAELAEWICQTNFITQVYNLGA